MAKRTEVSYHTLAFICRQTDILRPRKEMSLSEWANENMMLPEGSNEAGSFSTLPHQKEIMDAISSPYVQNVTVMSGAQIGKTTIVLAGIGYFIEHEPATQLMVLPTLTLGEKFSKTRLAKMIREVPVLAAKVAPPRTKDSDNTILFKEYPGGHIVVAGANSAASLSSMPLRIIWMDETDRYPASAGSEGNPIKLAEARATSFWNKKFIKTSTPGNRGDSKIEDAFLKGSQETWSVRCPCCGAWQPYSFQRMVFADVAMACLECGEIIPERDWKESQHRWIAKHPERTRDRSFHINAMASPWVSWQELIDDFKSAIGRLERFHDPEDLKTFVNTKLGETWDDTDYDTERKVDEEVLEGRSERYLADIPDGVLMLTASVDVQDNRFEVEVRGWAREYETWGIYKTEIYGNLKLSAAWGELEEYLFQTFYYQDGRALNVAAVAIDTGGHHTNDTYKWIKKMREKGKSVYGIKGYSQKPGLPLVYKQTKVYIKQKLKNGKEIVVDSTTIYILGVDAGKEDIANQLEITEPGEGYCHFPSNGGRGYDATYYKGLLSERKIEKKVRGIIKTVWVKKSGVRNEPLDLFNYNLAACMIRKPNWDSLEEKLDKGINYMAAGSRRKSARKRGCVNQGIEV